VAVEVRVAAAVEELVPAFHEFLEAVAVAVAARVEAAA
jgi:hypothetical protein